MGNPDGTGSLGDKTKMNHTVKDGVLEVTDDAERNEAYKFAGIGYDTSKSLAENIIEGYGNKQFYYNKPRNFIQRTIEIMKENKPHLDVFKEELERRLDSKIVVE